MVDCRAVVDQATEEAERIKKNACDPELRVSTLRGQYVDNREWLEDPAAPAIILGTVDMIGAGRGAHLRRSSSPHWNG